MRDATNLKGEVVIDDAYFGGKPPGQGRRRIEA
jgi:hypothetical protein